MHVNFSTFMEKVRYFVEEKGCDIAAIYIYICRAVTPLNSRMATKVVGAEGINSGEKDLIPVAEG